MRDDPRTLQARLAEFLAPWPAKELADKLDCDVRTAENVRRGYWPTARTWRGIVRTFGRDVLDAVFSPDIDETLARLSAEERRLQDELALLRRHRQAFEGAGQGRAERRAEGAADVDDLTLPLFPEERR